METKGKPFSDDRSTVRSLCPQEEQLWTLRIFCNKDNTGKVIVQPAKLQGAESDWIEKDHLSLSSAL